jgi:hypothetical protein
MRGLPRRHTGADDDRSESAGQTVERAKLTDRLGILSADAVGSDDAPIDGKSAARPRPIQGGCFPKVSTPGAPGVARHPVVVVTAKDLTPEERQRLNGHVERILAKGALGPEALLAEVRELVAASLTRRRGAPRLADRLPPEGR